MDHLGVEVFSSDEVTAATHRLTDSGLSSLTEDDTECCYALQDKVWVQGPGREPWEVYVVKGDAGKLGKAPNGECCCGVPDGTGAAGAVVPSSSSCC
jgi:hypothetical protein